MRSPPASRLRWEAGSFRERNSHCPGSGAAPDGVRVITRLFDGRGSAMSRTSTGKYRCEWDKASLTDQENGPTHLSIVLGEGTGIASKDGPLTGWRVYRKIRPGRYHFCGVECFALWLPVITSLPESEQPIPDKVPA